MEVKAAVFEVALQLWSEGDLALLEKLQGDPGMMIHLGGPESPEKIARRHERYLHLPDTDHMFKIVRGAESEAVGSIGLWEKEWGGELVYETGWSVLPAYQGKGIAGRAAGAILELARREKRYPFVHAFPSVENAASNAICRTLGFELVEQCRFEYPPGHFLRANDWRLALDGA